MPRAAQLALACDCRLSDWRRYRSSKTAALAAWREHTHQQTITKSRRTTDKQLYLSALIFYGAFERQNALLPAFWLAVNR